MKITAKKRKTTAKNICLLAILLLVLSFSFALPLSNLALAQPTEPADGDFTIDPIAGRTAIDFDAVTGGIRWGDCGFDPLCGTVKGIRSIILGVLAALGGFFAFLLGAAASFLKIMVFVSTRVVQLPIVETGFSLTLSFTNILFVLAIIIMAFATILRFENWSAKALLKRLIIAAILVNFSFFIAGVILDTTNVFTGVFSKAFDPKELGTAINPQQIVLSFGAKIDRIWFDDPDHDINAERERNNPGAAQRQLKLLEAGTIDGRVLELQMPLNEADWGQFFKILQGLLLAVFLTLILTISVFALAIMVLIRSFYIAFLLILMPLIWPISVMPALKKYWDQWWASFLKWAIFLPTVSFFIWLAVTSMMVMNSSSSTIANEIKKLASGDPFAQIVLMIFNTLFIAGLILSGLFVSKRLSLAGSAGGLLAAGWIGSKIKGGAKRGAIGAGKFAVRNPGKVAGGAAGVALGASGLGLAGAAIGGIAGYKGGKKTEEGVKRAGRGAAGLGSKMATSGVVGRLLTGNITKRGAEETANKLAAKANAAEKVSKRQKERYGNLTNAQIEAALKAPPPQGTLDQAALLQEAAKRKMADKVDPENAKVLADATIKAFNLTSAEDAPAGEGVPGVKEMMTANPELAATLQGHDPTSAEGKKAIKDFVVKLSGNELLKIKKLDDPTVASSISENGVRYIASRGSAEQKEKLEKQLAGAISEEIKKKIKEESRKLNDAAEKMDFAKANNDQVGYDLARTEKEIAKEKRDGLLESEGGSTYQKVQILKKKMGDPGNLTT